ncbi:type III PLP-dependent enzyme [Govanella unica]|uniref:ornithine decarboxylase n=1 Tax=Govanella unica TaxID=2975056 RepID=A0A9X3TZI1_9PROT|nr:type III PLP-dependent enzyme [Govania unica]MDA5194840.1 type III PLP-dependent enzyme [Govania unica]
MTSQLLSLPIDSFRDDADLAVFASLDEAVATLRPDEPVQVLYPDELRANARAFLTQFPGQTLYAVKVNPDRRVLQYLYNAGVRHFDVASEGEVELVHSMFPNARLSFMHPIKSRRAIASAFRMGVRDFVIDSESEIIKVIEETNAASRINLFVRIALPKGSAAYDLSGKFGAEHDEAVTLLRQARRVSHKLGLCFHVGSQCLNPVSYREAIEKARAIVAEAGVTLDILDIGGGFPVAYPDMVPPPFEDYMAEIRQAVADNGFAATELWCEPGRGLAGTGGKVIVKVEHRRGDKLYLNDGTYGSLFDAGQGFGWRYPARLIRPDAEISATDVPQPSPLMKPFSFFGPTCDNIDFMKGPFYLPEDVQEGDWIEIGQLGAYGFAMRTGFNGFKADTTVAVRPEPIFPVEVPKAARPIRIQDKLVARRAVRAAHK